ncbi:hypothetical protein IC582_014196 [Cucumis melo]|uniref:Envelope-like protein n=1 Tax=Cucumis melo var. makuwa TaxID=1194695 RepID=A0A5A7V1Q0_CUCMM|nr:uncharacterized protein E6C27_scaffold22G002180 [Cucumis melo var. makuwa]TYK22146.1 uncharacterized protein E5676_scaffold318G001560 [Cucumis melo var. makuwa]
MHDKNIVAENVETEPVVSEAHMSEMDYEELDDIPLARLLKKGLFSTAKPTIADVPVTLLHSYKSLSSDDIFIPTLGQPSTTNEEIGKSGHSLPVRFPIQTHSPNDVQQSILDANLVGQSTDNVGENIAEIVHKNPGANVDDHVELTYNSTIDDGVPNVNVPPTESEQASTKSRAKGKKSQESCLNITTETERKKIRLNIPPVPINGISFHLEESVQRWKYVVQRHIADEVNVFNKHHLCSDKHHFCLSVMDLIVKARLSKVIFNVESFYPQLIKEFILNLPLEFNNPSSPDYKIVHIRGLKFKISPIVINGFLGNTMEPNSTLLHPSNDVLTFVLSGRTLSIWPVNEIPRSHLVSNMPFFTKLALPTGSTLHMLPVFLLF